MDIPELHTLKYVFILILIVLGGVSLMIGIAGKDWKGDYKWDGHPLSFMVFGVVLIGFACAIYQILP